MKQMKISLPDDTYKKLYQEAAALGFSINAVARLRLSEWALGFKLDAQKKTYMFALENWREIEAYVRVKKPGVTMSQFAVEAVDALTRRNALKPAQKAEVEALLKK